MIRLSSNNPVAAALARFKAPHMIETQQIKVE